MRARRSVTRLAFVAGVMAASLLAGCGSSAAAPPKGIEVIEATIDRPANPQQAALRLVIRNDGDTADVLTGASSPRAEQASIHRTVEDAEGRTDMAMVKRLDIPANGEITFDPRTYHVMLEGFAEPLEVGDEVPVAFTFQKAGTKKVTAKVIEPGSANEEHDMNHGADHGTGHRHD